MNWQGIKIRALKWGRRILVYGTTAFAIAFAGAFGILQIPYVQESLLNRIMERFSAVSGYEVDFDTFYLVWYDRLEITGLRITDPEKNPMIEAGKLFVNFSLRSVYQGGDIYLDAVSLQGGAVNLITIPSSDSTSDLNINLFIAAIDKQLSSGKGGGNPAKVNIGEILLEQSHFSYNNSGKDSIPKGFDYNHFQLALDEGNVDNFKVIGDTIEFNVNSLQLKDHKTELTVHQLSTFFRISQKAMEFQGISLDANRSHIADTVILRYDSQADLSDFNNKVSIQALLKDTRLYPEDIALFTQGLETWKKPLLVNGRFSGRVNHFVFSPMEILIGNSAVRGKLEMDGLPAIRETFINAGLSPSVVDPADIAFLLPSNVAASLGGLGTIKMHGSFIGFITDFVANGDFNTRFGNIKSDINYKISEDIGQSAYSGNLQLAEFDLGRFLGDTINFQHVSMKGKISGKGFTEKTADFILNGDISSIGLLGYDYTNIQSNARFANQFFNGALKIDDPNLQFDMTGSIDLRGDLDLINIEARLDTALLQQLKLTQEEVFLQSYLNIDSRGLKLDSITGKALFKNTRLQFRDESIRFDSVHIVSSDEDGMRSLSMRSSVADLSLTGNFYYTTLFGDIQTLIHEFLLNLKNDPEAIHKYYASKKKATQAYKASIKATVHDANPLFDVLDLNLRASPETVVEGEFSNSSTSVLRVYSRLDTLEYEGRVFSGNEIEFDGSKVRDSTRVLAQLTLRSDHQYIDRNLSTKKLFAEGIWDRDHIDLELDVDQDGFENKARIQAEVDFLSDSTRVRLLPSTISILQDDWTVNQGNYLLIKGKEWAIHQLGFRHDDQFIRLDGEVSQDPLKVLTLDVTNFDLSFLNFFSREKFRGLLSAEVKSKDLYQNAFLENILRIDSLTINNFLVGDIKGNNSRNPESGHFNIDLTVDRLQYRIVDIKGYYDPEDTQSPLHTKAILKKANLKLLEPVIKDLFTQLDGTLTGEYEIEGGFTTPRITGEAAIENGQVLINYLKTLYKVEGVLGMTPQQIQFNNFKITDAYKNEGKLQGYIAHRNFSKMRINLDASFSNFQVMNTTIKDNNLFYGQAFGTGTLNIMGPVSNLKISATARTNKNTRLFIPVGTTSTEEKKEFIQFTSFTQTVRKKKVVPKTQKKELSGLTLDLDIDVTPDAYGEIIFDIKSGDIIRGRGRGDIKLQVDTKGEFNMFGLMEFTEGAYNFTLYDIINKEFQIKPGSRITWYGDPYEGNLAIAASYRQYTSMGPILQGQPESVTNDPNIKRKYPVEVLLKLDGPMLSPQIVFDLEAKDLPDNVVTADGHSVRLRFEFNAFKTKLDEQELKRQVFSLIILRKLSPPDAFATSGSLYNSVSELLSNQLSYWLSQVDQNLEIDLDLGTLDQEAFNTFQLRLSYSFLGGRLRVSKDGNFGNQPNRSELSTIAGDWTVDYLLTPDGKFKVKMYSRSTVNQLNSSLNTQTAAVTTGASLLYTQNFNQFSDLLRSARDRRRKELEQNPPKEDDGTH
ncbi:MAG: translocation/assembly module TamB domain-containing protein [Bacteroidetes bacterium]|nr:translocation/assembly module TamB domain-containing protein [Bacteroidota bacterium]